MGDIKKRKRSYLDDDIDGRSVECDFIIRRRYRSSKRLNLIFIVFIKYLLCVSHPPIRGIY
jgi:hypothetical protein